MLIPSLLVKARHIMVMFYNWSSLQMFICYRCTLLAEIRDDTGSAGSGHRVVWCPYIPDDEDEAPDEDVAKLVLTTHGNIG